MISGTSRQQDIAKAYLPDSTSFHCIMLLVYIRFSPFPNRLIDRIITYNSIRSIWVITSSAIGNIVIIFINTISGARLLSRFVGRADSQISWEFGQNTISLDNKELIKLVSLKKVNYCWVSGPLRSNLKYRMSGNEEFAKANLTNCYKEMGCLADLLPDLYTKEANGE